MVYQSAEMAKKTVNHLEVYLQSNIKSNILWTKDTILNILCNLQLRKGTPIYVTWLFKISSKSPHLATDFKMPGLYI